MEQNVLSTLSEGTRLQITTKNEILVGTFKSRMGEARMILSDVLDTIAEYHYPSDQYIALAEIVSYKILTEGKSPESPLEESTSEKAICLLSEIEIEKIKKHAENVVVLISSAESDIYNDALLDIQNQVCVTLFSVICHQTKDTVKIVIGTSRSIYIFDLKLIKSVPKSLKALLKSETPFKIIFKPEYNIKHKNIYNLHNICVHLRKVPQKPIQTKGLNLVNTIIDVLGVRNDDLLCTKDKLHDCQYEKPCLLLLAKIACFQRELFYRLNHDYRLSKFNHECAQFANTFLDAEYSTEILMALSAKKEFGMERFDKAMDW